VLFLFTINLDPAAEMFTPAGKFPKGYLTVDFACLSCHKNVERGWILEKTSGHHA